MAQRLGEREHAGVTVHRSIAATIACACILLLVACGEKEIVVLEPEPVVPSPEAAGVIEDFRKLTGDELVAVAHDSDLLGFPGDADDPRLNESAELLILESGGEATSGEPTGLQRYGRFVINVVNSDGARGGILFSDETGQALTRDPSNGIFWERLVLDGPDGPIEQWLAHKPYGNVVLTWLSNERATDARWAALDRALGEIGPDQKGATPSGQKGTARQGNAGG